MIVGENYRAFISYSHEDRDFVDRLYEDLQSDGTSQVWLDVAQIRPGESIASSVTEAIGAAGVFLLVASENSLSSNWVQFELEQAIYRKVTDSIPIVVLKVSDVTLPISIAPFMYIDFSKSYQSGLLSLKAFLTSDAQPREPRQRPEKGVGKRCTAALNNSTGGQLRRAISQGLSRDEMSVVWFDLFGTRMDDECRHLPPANCALELIARAEARFAKPALIDALCRDHEHLVSRIE